MSSSGTTITNIDNNMESTPFFHEFKKQASFFIKEKIKTARLALTDVTPAQLLTEEATNANPRAPDARSLGLISRAAFEVDEYWRIVDILHQKLLRFHRKNWRPTYKALIVLEHLMTHGPESVVHEFQCDRPVIKEMQKFQHVDEKGFNWGLAVRKKAEIVGKLLENGPLLKEERKRVRSITRGIKGFGSFSERTTSVQELPRDHFGRSHTQFNDHADEEDSNEELAPVGGERPKDSKPFLKTPKDVSATEDLNLWDEAEEGDSLLSKNRDETNKRLVVEEDHPFYKSEKRSSRSLLAAGDDD
ncbi:Clathrin interactor 1-like protein [Drosera capensis]